MTHEEKKEIDALIDKKLHELFDNKIELIENTLYSLQQVIKFFVNRQPEIKNSEGKIYDEFSNMKNFHIQAAECVVKLKRELGKDIPSQLQNFNK